ncbi:prolactin receptor a isoform X1 [Electrophorus electricus]|nr:prolactin receptor a isoform X1 [Electrophorus electricus]XP_035383491.1 prolactin receptor a isoform X1 [Electrophorus electricus]XP_035383492.1 prolactin receptor a isoform X1 [Electrophorus electricus]XP_035383493.1 prolactin receptor a isoform X1 [Electrophorus electricus]
MWTDSVMLAGLTLTAIFVSHTAGVSAPGRPRLTGCRSPEKETFTCWWEPGDDGGLPTTYALYYHLEGSETVYECPDYRTAGKNSCFFSKNNTSLWVNYNISVVATNAMGSSVSEPVDVDVVYIVQPNTPEDVRVLVVDDDPGPYLHVSWEKPLAADTQSGWITLVYQLRVKETSQDTWEEYNAGMQKGYNIFSLLSGREYAVQVRCKPDHGFWSEWTSPAYVQIPDYMLREHSMWIIVAVFAGFLLFVLTWTVNVKRSSVKHCLLPPVPGPKIRGFDPHLLKSGRSEEMFSALVTQHFPPTSSYDDLLVEYLEVYDVEKQELVLGVKNEDPLAPTRTSDNDSGRGSCDSRTLLTERYAEDGDKGGADRQLGQCVAELASPPLEEEKVEAWSTPFSPPPLHLQRQQVGGARAAYHSVLEIPCDSPCAPGSYGHQGESDISKPGGRGASTTLAEPQAQSAEYVEVQTVDHENVLLLRPLADPGGPDVDYAGEDYSKIRDVIPDNVLLLQREPSAWPCAADPGQDRGERSCPTALQELMQPCKPPGPLQQGLRLVANGYVDASAMLC